ncbi:hypothetical protein [Spiroplasma diminutum]|uniref:Uncharacterized protein n=1 Tax=Spiroplasma diminutum CUAS-1 TaxID=1276221 RepID=S5LWC9_9MOLU|nr:hypothetical protein [Spiroplasma diminutum]AGR42094.1 hypothetical protein SDIMI_v3c03900 [Spiroplasma diminutum CUAS-1]
MIIQIIGLPNNEIESLANYLSKKYSIPYIDISYFNKQNKTEAIRKYSEFILNNQNFIITGSMYEVIYSSFYKRDYLIWLDKDDKEKLNTFQKMNAFNMIYKEYEICKSNKIIIDSKLNLREQEKLLSSIIEKKDYEKIQR